MLTLCMRCILIHYHALQRPVPHVTLCQVIYHGDKLDSGLELLEGILMVQSDHGDVALVLRVRLPRADVTLQGDLSYGLLPTESRAIKIFQIINNGDAAAVWKVEWDRCVSNNGGSGIKCRTQVAGHGTTTDGLREVGMSICTVSSRRGRGGGKGRQLEHRADKIMTSYLNVHLPRCLCKL